MKTRFCKIMSVLLVLALVFAMPFNARAEEGDISDPRCETSTESITYIAYIINEDGSITYMDDDEDGISIGYSTIYKFGKNQELYGFLDGQETVHSILPDVSGRQWYDNTTSSYKTTISDWFSENGYSQDDIHLEFKNGTYKTSTYYCKYVDVYRKTFIDINPWGEGTSVISNYCDAQGNLIIFTGLDYVEITEEEYNQLTPSRDVLFSTETYGPFCEAYTSSYYDVTYVYYVDLRSEESVVDTTPIYTVVGSDEEGTTAVPAMTYDEGTKDGFTFVVKDTAAEPVVLTKDDLLEVYVDGKLVDPSNYTVSTGCIIITFTQSFMDSLGSGDHSISVGLKDGGKCSVLVSVKKTEESSAADESSKTEESSKAEESSTETSQPAEQPTSTTPKSDATGNNIALELSAFALMIATCGLMIYKKRREN